MKALLALVAALAVALPTTAGAMQMPQPTAAPQLTEPEAIVRSIYAAYTADSWPQQVEERFFTPDLLQLWTAVVNNSGDDLEYAVDFDIYLNAQDTDAITVRSTHVMEHDGRTDVAIVFTSFGEERTFVYSMVETGDGWKIDDLSWGGDGFTLRGMLADLKARQDAR
jgi:hypothetical protein